MLTCRRVVRSRSRHDTAAGLVHRPQLKPRAVSGHLHPMLVLHGRTIVRASQSSITLLAISPDGKRLYADGGTASASDPRQGRKIGLSAIVALNDHDFPVLERDNRGIGVDNPAGYRASARDIAGYESRSLIEEFVRSPLEICALLTRDGRCSASVLPFARNPRSAPSRSNPNICSANRRRRCADVADMRCPIVNRMQLGGIQRQH